ncbi:hypothetical protein D918_06989 [Trichuris suis]|nr:hypothetical protein D918_06989 [Trichuris suis]
MSPGASFMLWIPAQVRAWLQLSVQTSRPTM